MVEPKTDVQRLAAQMQKEGKSVITLILKQKYFNAILAGRKVQEFREVRPTTYKRLILHDADGFDIEDENGMAQPIHYDAILFYAGYNTNRDSALVEVKDAYVQYFVDENDKIIEYQADDGVYWQASQVVYNLGKILCTDLHHQDILNV